MSSGGQICLFFFYRLVFIFLDKDDHKYNRIQTVAVIASTMNSLGITEETWEKAAKQFGRSKKCLDDDVETLRIWLKTQPHYPDIIDTCSLRNFILLNKFSVEIAKQKINNYYTLRTNLLKNLFVSSNPKLPHAEEFCKEAFLVVHSELTHDLSRIFYFKSRNGSLMETYEPLNFFRRMVAIQEMRFKEDVMCGDFIIADCKELTIPILLKITPTVLYNAVLLYEKVLSIRIKGIYLLNLHPFGKNVLALVKKLMKPKLFSRIHVFTDAEELKKVVPLKVLAKEFGGEGPSLVVLEELLNDMFGYHQKLFDTLDEMKVDESKRPPNLENDDMLGVYGNFKKLEID